MHERDKRRIIVVINAVEKNDQMLQLQRLFPSSHQNVKIIKLLGYSNMNKENDPKKRYSIAKRPIMKGWQDLKQKGLNPIEIQQWLNQRGWIGLLIPGGYDVVDVDEMEEGRYLFHALKQEGYHFHAIQTVRGFQFIFQSSGTITGQDAEALTAGGFVVDYRLAGKGQIVLPTANTEGRNWIHQAAGELSTMPIFFNRLKKVGKQSRHFPIPLSEGGRNNTLYKHCCRLVEFGYSQEEIEEIVHFLNKYFFLPPLDQREFANTVASALKKEPSGKAYRQGNRGRHEPPHVQVSDDDPEFNLTEVGNAERLVHFHGDKLRYCMEFEEWLIWDGRAWKKDHKKLIERIAINTFRMMYQEAGRENDDNRRRDLTRWAQSSERSAVLLNSIDRTKAFFPVLQADLNRDPFQFNCENGVIDLRTGELLGHDVSYLITNQSNVRFDPDAECPTWMNFLESVMKGKTGNVKHELIEFLQKAIGYALTGDTSEQVAFFLWGNGRNGKSTFINTIKELIGDYGKQTNPDTFTSKIHEGGINNDIARLSDARFVSAVESEDGQRLSESLIKQLTGGEPITARFLRKEFFEFVPAFKIFFTTNHKPIIKGNDEGIWRRIRLIPFTVTIPKEEVDTRLPEKLRAELPGILNWAVKGCLKWQQEGLGEPTEIKQATQGYKDEMDILGYFLNEHCVEKTNARISVKELYERYREWCKDTGEYEISQRKFNRRIEERGYLKKRSGKGGNTEFHGIGLLTNRFTEETERN